MDFLRYLVPSLLIAVAVVAGLWRAIFRVGEHERLIVFRLGRPVGLRGPGLVVLVPFLQSGIKLDLTDDLDARTLAEYERQLGEVG